MNGPSQNLRRLFLILISFISNQNHLFYIAHIAYFTAGVLLVKKTLIVKLVLVVDRILHAFLDLYSKGHSLIDFR